MMEAFFSPSSLPFSVAIAFMLVIALMEIAGALLGLSPSAAIDNMLPDVDLEADATLGLPDVDIVPEASYAPSTPSVGPLSQILGWLCIGRVPVLVLLIIFLTAFGLSGFAIQGLANGLLGFYLPSAIAVVPALIVAFPCLRITGLTLARMMPKEETEAVSVEQFIGKIATITLGEARRGLPAEAKLTDNFGQAHYVRVEPDQEHETFPVGTEVILVKRSGAHFLAIANNNPAMSD